MKKLFILLFVTMLGMSAYASDQTGKALSLRTSVKSYLQSEGYAPSIDSDGDIAFKYQGSNFWISFENWRERVYVNIFSQLDTDGASVAKLRKAADEAQRAYKFVRLNVNNSNISISVTVAAQIKNDVTNLLNTYIEIVKDAKQLCKDKYNEE